MKCKKCGQEMNLIESDNILGYWSLVCSNDGCNMTATVDNRYDKIEWEGGE